MRVTMLPASHHRHPPPGLGVVETGIPSDSTTGAGTTGANSGSIGDRSGPRKNGTYDPMGSSITNSLR